MYTNEKKTKLMSRGTHLKNIYINSARADRAYDTLNQNYAHAPNL